MYPLIRNALFRMDAERAHITTMRLLSLFPSAAHWLTVTPRPSPLLQQSLWGLNFSHPVGLAAGLDKDGVAVNALFDAGFSFVEVGTVTPKEQPGNDKPRLFRLIEDGALINRMGFNNHGEAALRKNLLKKRRIGTVGINFGKNKITANDRAADDYVELMETLYPLGDYIVINVSSPNTPGLRDLQTEHSLIPLVERVLAKRDELYRAHEDTVQPHRPPVLVKLSPDLSDSAVQSLGKSLAGIGVDGFIATNTTLDRPKLLSANKLQSGGLSGRPLAQRSTQVIRLLYQATQGAIPIIGSGGVFSAEDAYEKICAGASLLQIYTAFIYKGPPVIAEIVTELEALLAHNGFHHITEAVGSKAEDHVSPDI
ncbi:dihydroorotate dehydrogenase (quinone) [Alicyclobacillus sp. SO9]|uniref:dihydroorotate dehydrogenase (quinone) n=1 Tax=Alicyclobacillus sp. SO9 TaxID=2665646 RepID=UPI0018E7E861|nr:dihydroorotate dehydrogenase (quinone) [Alicyclobacillus sp. SO9]QQE80283.1 dihydroorotate dehydrogenase (quinone) [Alicyclobacillus sp. SO9]